MSLNKNKLERANSDSSNQDLDNSSVSENLFFETLRQETQKLANILPFILLESFNPTLTTRASENSSSATTPPTELRQEITNTSQESVLSSIEFQGGEVDTVFSYPPRNRIENIIQGEYTYISKYSFISILGMGDMKTYLNDHKIKWDKERTRVDSLKLKLTTEIPFDKLNITGNEDPQYIKQQIILYHNLNREYPFNFISGIGPIYDYDEFYKSYALLDNNSIDIFWKIENPNENTEVILIDLQNSKVYVQFTAKAIKNTIYDENSNGRPETDEEYYERLKEVFDYLYKLPNIPAKGGFVLNIGLPRHFEGVWGDNPILKIPCLNPEKVGLQNINPYFLPLAQIEVSTQIKYIDPDSTGTPADSSGTTPGQNGNPEIPESYKLVAYPNPVEAGKTVNLITHIKEPGNYTLRIYDLLGREIWGEDYFINQENTTHTFQIPTLGPDGQPLPRGIYFARLEYQNGKTTPSTTKMIIFPQK